MLHSKMNALAPAGFSLSVFSFLMSVFSGLCTFSVILNPTFGVIAGIVALVASSVGLTMTGIARYEIVQNAQYGDEFAVSGMVVGIVVCAFSVAVLVLYFVLFK